MSTLNLRGPARIVVRQHRFVLWGWGAVALVGAALAASAWWFTSAAADDFAGTGCSVQHTVSGCGIPVRHLLSIELQYNHLFRYAALAIAALPALVGLFVAGPVIGRELEDGTYRFACGQSVSPARWLAAKLAVTGAFAVAGVTLLSAVYAWTVSRTHDTHYPLSSSEWWVYDSMGPVPVAHTLLGLALGALVALLLGRALRSMALAAVVCLLVALATRAVRPAANFWPLQLAETGIVLLLAGGVTALAFRVLRRYHA
ncbi:hypothetical protein [Streptomyces sp. NBC_00525]|uniref:hypothetical protein n=1 Tax=Streptomyces sp. NBC_00525 TaxID=2903660 RepID=UPI002E81CB44|nr:hypothetical protein [Streptomyces sp. NBC_00525]WUC94965.1 hypothetical protein OG710_15875 [Streptomyces sp. NBC_00525]